MFTIKVWFFTTLSKRRIDYILSVRISLRIQFPRVSIELRRLPHIVFAELHKS